MSWQQSSPLAAAASAMGGFVDEQDKKREAARQAELDKQTAAETAAKMAYETAQAKKLAKDSASDDAAQTYAKGLAWPDNWSKMKPQEQIDWLRKNSFLAYHAGNKDLGDLFNKQAADIGLSGQQLANADYTTQGKLPEAKAHTGLYGSQEELNKARADYTRGWRIRERDKVANLDRVATDKERAEAERARQMAAGLAARVSIARAGQAGASERAQALLDGRETMAIMAQEFALEGRPAAEAAKLAQSQYEAQLKQWETQNTLGQVSAAAAGQSYTPTEMPTFNINAGAPPPSAQPMVVNMTITLPDGTKTVVPHVVMRPPAANLKNPKTPTKPQSATSPTKHNPATIPAPPQQNPLASWWHWFTSQPKQPDDAPPPSL